MSTDHSADRCYFCQGSAGGHPMSAPHYLDRDTCIRVTVCPKGQCRDLLVTRRPRKPRIASTARRRSAAGAGDVAGWSAAARLGRRL